MKIKVKVKTIILFTLLIAFFYLVLVPFTTLQVARFLDSRYSEKSKVFYESFISKALIWNKSEALYGYGQRLIGPTNKYQIMMGGWAGGDHTVTMDDMEKGIESLKKIIEKENKSKKDLKYARLAYGRIMDAYIKLQSPEDLIHWINWGKDEADEKINYISDLYLAFYHFANRDYGLAEKILDNYNEDSPLIDYGYYFLRGELALWKGDIELSKELYSKGRSTINLKTEAFSQLFSSYSYNSRDYWFKDHYDRIKGKLKVSGKVTFDGKPMPFVEVYLQEIGAGIRVGGGYLIGITDVNGEYETLGFRPDRYEIGIGLDEATLPGKVYQRPDKEYIDLKSHMDFDFSFVSPLKVIRPGTGETVEGDKFQVEWEEVQDADYYHVTATSFLNFNNKSQGNVTFPIEDENYNYKLKGNKATFDLNILRDKFIGAAWDGEDFIALPTAILGIFLPDNQYPIMVNAYDRNGNLINSSGGLRIHYEDLPSFNIQRDLTVGEELILKMKYEEAIEHYSKVLEKDGNNKEALFYLSKIYMIGYKAEKRNLDKALDYGIRYDDLHKGNTLTYQLMEYMDKEFIRKNRTLLEETIKNTPKENRDDNFYHRLGKFYLSIGDYKGAKEILEKVDSYKPIDILYIDLYYGDLDRAIELINSEVYGAIPINISTLEKINRSQPEDYKVIKDLVENILSQDISEADGRKLAENARVKIRDNNVKLLFGQIIKERGWDFVIWGENP